MKKLFLLAAICLLMPFGLSTAKAVPAKPTPMEFVQPDGDTLIIRLVGDERHHMRLTEDGILIVQNKKGFYCYGYINRKGEQVAGRKVAHNAGKRTKCENRYIARLNKKSDRNRQRLHPDKE